MSIDLVISRLKGYDNEIVMHFEAELRMINRILDQSVREGVAVSIGSFRGKMDCAIAMHAHVPVYCIDPRTPSDGFPFGDIDRVFWMQNMLDMNVAAKVRPINLPSQVVAAIWAEPISFLWIDGDHSRAADDLDAWMPHVMDGGLVALHDIGAPSVVAAVAGRNDLVEVERADLTAVFRKQGEVVYREYEIIPAFERYEYNGLALDVRTGVYGPADKHAVQEVQTYNVPSDHSNAVHLHTVIDAGAHIGAFTAWIKHLYPDALVTAVEVEQGNFDLLHHNVARMPGTYCLHAALTYDPELSNLIVDPINSGGHHLSHDYKPEQKSVIPPPDVTLEMLMDGRFADVDLLKLDIEGSEVDVLLFAASSTLQRIHMIIGERHVTHDEFQPMIDRLESLGFTVEDIPHPELSVEPWLMADRGLFTAVNRNWNVRPFERSIEREAPTDVSHEDLKPKRKPGRKKKMA